MINWIVPQGKEEWSSTNALTFIKEKLGEDAAKVSNTYDKNAINVNYRILSNIPQNVVILNRPQNIITVGDKRRFRYLLMKEMPEYAPRVYSLNDRNLPFPLIVRPDHHQQGSYFRIVKSYKDINKLKDIYTHAIEIIYPNDEFRVVCCKKFDDSIIAISFKKKEITYEENNENWLKNVKPKNYSKGNSIFRWIPEHSHKDLIKEVAKRAFVLSGLHFGAVDILFDTRRNIPFVIEINSRFAIGSEGLTELFGNYIIRYEKDYERSKKE